MCQPKTLTPGRSLLSIQEHHHATRVSILFPIGIVSSGRTHVRVDCRSRDWRHLNFPESIIIRAVAGVAVAGVAVVRRAAAVPQRMSRLVLSEEPIEKGLAMEGEVLLAAAAFRWARRRWIREV